jgi:hypothetical protein
MNAFSVTGRYKFIITDSQTGAVRTIDWFDNLITDLGLEQIATQNSGIQTLALGTGSTEPNVLDTSLSNYLNKTTNNSNVTSGVQSVEPYFGWNRFSFNFPLDSVTGNISEVGVMLGSASETQLFSRALIKENGVPITVTILPTDYVTVIYEIRIYPPLTDVSTNITIAGTNHTFTLRAAHVTNAYWGNRLLSSLSARYWWASPYFALYVHDELTELGAITTALTGTYTGVGVPTTLLPYEANSHRLRVTMAFSVSQANLPNGLIGGIQMASDRGGGAYQILIDPPIPKDATKTLSLTFAYSWQRYTP